MSASKNCGPLLGPLVGLANRKIVVFGITSLASKCEKDPHPILFTRVAAQRKWILDNSNADGCQ
jgi:hypothetical protein